MDRRVCLPHAATAAFEVQSAPAYALIITVLTEPMTPMTVHAPPTSASGLGSPRAHLHRKLPYCVFFKVRLRRIPPETRRVCMRARVRQYAPMHAGMCVPGCASVRARACVRVRARNARALWWMERRCTAQVYASKDHKGSTESLALQALPMAVHTTPCAPHRRRGLDHIRAGDGSTSAPGPAHICWGLAHIRAGTADASAPGLAGDDRRKHSTSKSG